MGCRPADAAALGLVWCRTCIAALSILDAHLSGHHFLVGDVPTIADICCYADTAFVRLSNKDLAAWVNVIAWAERIEALPGFAKPFDLLAMQDAQIEPSATQPELRMEAV